MSLRITVNILILLVSATALGILLYCIINFKKVVNKAINTTLVVVEDNKSKIQPVVTDFANNTVNGLLNNKSIVQKGTDVITTQTEHVLNEGKLDKSLTNQSTRVLNNNDTKIAIANIINSPQVTKAISNAIVSSLGGGNMYTNNVSLTSTTPFEQALINNINNPEVANAIGSAVKNYPNNQTTLSRKSNMMQNAIQHESFNMNYKNNYNINN